MWLRQLFESDNPDRAAGCVVLASDSKRLLFAHRSLEVSFPGTFCTFGGSLQDGETPLAAMKRELIEETGYIGTFKTKPLFVYTDNDFSYANFLAIVPTEFNPRLNDENQGYTWCEFGDWPAPLHPGLKALLSDPASLMLLTQKGLMKKDSVETSTPAVI